MSLYNSYNNTHRRERNLCLGILIGNITYLVVNITYLVLNITYFVLYSGMEDPEKKEKMDTRRKRAGWDTRKLYEIMLMKEIPGIDEYSA